MNKTVKVILITVGVLFAVGVVSSATTTVNEKQAQEASKVSTVRVDKTKDDTYETRLPGAKSIFVEACAAGDGSSVATCTCLYNAIDADLTNDEFQDVLDMTDRQAIGVTSKYIAGCVEL